MSAVAIRLGAGAAALGALAYFALRTSPTTLLARSRIRESSERLLQAEAALRGLPRVGVVADATTIETWRGRVREAREFLAGDLLSPSGTPADLATARAELQRSLARPALPERMLGHLLPHEPWEAAGREPSREELEIGWRRLRISRALLEPLAAAGVRDFGFLVFPGGGRVEPDGAGGAGVAAKVRYSATASVHQAAYAALVGRREKGPFFVPERLLVAADPSGGGPDRVLVLLEVRVPWLDGAGG